MELIQNGKVRRDVLDRSPFADEGIVKVTPNIGKGLFVVTIILTTDIEEHCKTK